MKKRYFVNLTGSILVWAFTGCFTPSTVDNTARNFSETDDKIISDMRRLGLRNSNPYYLNEISTRAVRNFISTYRNARDPQWVKYRGGFVVYFHDDSIHCKVFYDKWGGHQTTIRQYSEQKLPHEIRHMVKSVYYDFSIYLIKELTAYGRTWYEVSIEDKTSFKEIKIAGGVMEVAKEFTKSK